MVWCWFWHPNLFPVKQLSTVQNNEWISEVSDSKSVGFSLKKCRINVNKANCDCICLKAHSIVIVVVAVLQFPENCARKLRVSLSFGVLPFASSTRLQHSFRFVFNNHLQMSIRPAPSLHLSIALSPSLTSFSVAHAQRISKETNRIGKRNWNWNSKKKTENALEKKSAGIPRH